MDQSRRSITGPLGRTRKTSGGVLAFGAFVALMFGGATPARAALVLILGSDGTTSATAQSTFSANLLTVTITNTSQFNAVITGIGYDLPPIGNVASPLSGVNGFTGDISQANSNLAFSDGALGNVPAGNGDGVLDFGFLTGNNFNGGKPNDGIAPIAPTNSETFTVFSQTGFGSLTESQIIGSIFVRFQGTGENGKGSSVGVGTVFPNVASVPEPSSLVYASIIGLVGVGYARRRRGVIAA